MHKARYIIVLVGAIMWGSNSFAQSDIEVTDSTSTGWGGGIGGGVTPAVPDEPVTSMTISHTTLTLEGGESARLTVTFNARAQNKKVTWSVTDPTVASVSSNGKVFGLGTGTTIVTATSVDNSSFTCTCTVTVTSDYANSTQLPDVPFEFYYNVSNYDETTHSIPNHADANLANASLQLTENIPALVGGNFLRINDICEGYIDRWDRGSTESGAYFFRQGQDCLTLVAKVAPRLNTGNASDFVTNRGGGYNYMWRIGDNNSMFLHTGSAYNDERVMPIQSEKPQIFAVRVNGKNNYILLQNLTTGESKRVISVNWGGGDNVFKFFYNNDGEFWRGDFY